ncbi:LysE family translocator [Acetobacteraceae bacterium B3987]|nr:LysE family translocator [Acetobacteraceae bacterium B3987]
MHQWFLPLLAFTTAAAIFTITPGLDSVMVLRTAASDGRRAGIGAIFGIAVGLSLWGLAAAFGLTALLAASSTAFFIVKCVGAVYLVWMGASQFLRPRMALTAEAAPEQARRVEHRNAFWPGFRRGLLTDLLNPKAGIFVITFFPQFIPPDADVVAFTLVQVVIQVLLTFIWLGLLVAMTVPLAQFFNRPVVVQRLDRLTGLVFIAFGAKIFLTDSPSH